MVQVAEPSRGAEAPAADRRDPERPRPVACERESVITFRALPAWTCRTTRPGGPTVRFSNLFTTTAGGWRLPVKKWKTWSRSPKAGVASRMPSTIARPIATRRRGEGRRRSAATSMRRWRERSASRPGAGREAAGSEAGCSSFVRLLDRCMSEAGSSSRSPAGRARGASARCRPARRARGRCPRSSAPTVAEDEYVLLRAGSSPRSSRAPVRHSSLTRSISPEVRIEALARARGRTQPRNGAPSAACSGRRSSRCRTATAAPCPAATPCRAAAKLR